MFSVIQTPDVILSGGEAGARDPTTAATIKATEKIKPHAAQPHLAASGRKVPHPA
jgi:hypothetical protein